MLLLIMCCDLEIADCRMTPFRSMLLTLQSGLQRLTPRAQSVPAYAQVLRHSSMTLSRRTRISWSRVSPLSESPLR